MYFTFPHHCSYISGAFFSTIAANQMKIHYYICLCELQINRFQAYQEHAIQIVIVFEKKLL